MADDRARLAAKGRLLFEKACGADGPHACLDGFARYHIDRGEPEVVADLSDFVRSQVESLRQSDPHGRLASAEQLAERLRELLGEK